MKNPTRDPRRYHDLQNRKVAKEQKEIKVNGNLSYCVYLKQKRYLQWGLILHSIAGHTYMKSSRICSLHEMKFNLTWQ